jgi:F-type H+-transporting ATPase subunit delta
LKAAAQRYAQALVDVAIEQGNTDKVKSELDAFVELVGSSADLRNLLASPAVSRADKHGLMDKLASRMGISKTVGNFLRLLVDNRRTDMLAEICRAFDEVLHRRMKVAEAEITSARELGPQERDALNKALEKMLGKRVESRYAVNAELIGGALVRIGSTIYDGTVREQLNRLRAHLASE